mgnify:CR=1 FL=1
MNTFLVILFIIVVLAISLGIIYIYLYNKFNESIIRINEAESRIDSNLRDKYDLLNKGINIVKANTKVDPKAFNDFMILKTKKISNFELDRTLTKVYNEFLNIYDNNKELRDSDELYKTNKQIILIDEELTTLRNYYNANILNYNLMIKKIPTNIIAKLKKYNERLLYDLKDMNDNDYEDFKL